MSKCNQLSESWLTTLQRVISMIYQPNQSQFILHWLGSSQGFTFTWKLSTWRHLIQRIFVIIHHLLKFLLNQPLELCLCLPRCLDYNVNIKSITLDPFWCWDKLRVWQSFFCLPTNIVSCWNVEEKWIFPYEPNVFLPQCTMPWWYVWPGRSHIAVWCVCHWE